jgi:hypothetical protein
MNQSKFSLADLLTVLTAVAFGFLCFLGTNFYTLGNVPKSITAALIITILLFSTAFTAKRLKRTSVNFKTRFILEMALLVVFTLFFVFFTYMPFSHYFTVSANKNEIVGKLQTSIKQAENMFPAYEEYAENRKESYKSNLKSAVTASYTSTNKYTSYGFKSGIISNETQLNKKMGDLNAYLFPTNYSDKFSQKGIKEVATNWLLDAKNTTASWKSIGIPNVALDIENKSNQWKSILVEISKIGEKGEQFVDFTYELKFNEIKQYFTTVEKPSGISLIIAVVMWVLMMLSWFVTKRSTKSTIFKVKNKGEFDVEI